ILAKFSGGLVVNQSQHRSCVRHFNSFVQPRLPKAQDAEATLTGSPGVGLRRLNIGDLWVLLCRSLFLPVVGVFAQKLPKIAQVGQARSAGLLSERLSRLRQGFLLRRGFGGRVVGRAEVPSVLVTPYLPRVPCNSRVRVKSANPQKSLKMRSDELIAG